MSPEDKLQRWWNDRREAHTECSDLMAYLMDVIVATAKEYETLKATQTRWVKCSERMPEKVGSYIVKIWWATTSEYTTSLIFFYGYSYETSMAGFGLPKDGKVVAWLENVPKYAP